MGSRFGTQKWQILFVLIKDKELQWKIGVAIGDTPAGPFIDAGKPIDGIRGIYPKVFIDNYGNAYIYNNLAILAKLKPNMIELAEPTRKVIYGTLEIVKSDTTRFIEGSHMHKKDGISYYCYTCLKNKTHHGMWCYG